LRKLFSADTSAEYDTSHHNSGGSSDEETPVPIPNTAVKLISADDSLRVKVGHCQFIDKALLYGGFFVYTECGRADLEKFTNI
jgi:hypothetical protein